MKYFNRWFVTLLLLLSVYSLTSQPTTVQAEDGDEKQEDVAGATGFTYSVIFPENQIKADVGYYHLKLNPNDKQVLTIDLSNPGKEKLVIDISLNGAKTNKNGVIEYGESTIENDPSLKYDFKDIVTGPEKIELEGGETKKLELTVQMPEVGYDGVIAGGVQLMRAGQDEEDTVSESSKVINQYAYVIGILLQESDEIVTPELQLNDVSVNQSNYRNAIFVNFSNVMAAYLDAMTVEVQITKKGSDAVLYERKQAAMRMAPNSSISFPVSMNGERMVAGEYKAKIQVTAGNQKWEWDQEFEITSKDADKYNERDVGLVQEKGIDWQLVAMIIGGVVLLIVVLFILLFQVMKLLAKKTKKKKVKKRKKKD